MLLFSFPVCEMSGTKVTPRLLYLTSLSKLRINTANLISSVHEIKESVLPFWVKKNDKCV